jgi:serine phosphatase RsbU (regulator of sigma subunit)
MPNKQAIGLPDPSKSIIPFTTHELVLENGDRLYMFTDGFADQFGGVKGKKFKYTSLAEKMVINYQKPMLDQKQILVDTFENWRGDLEQVDDVCIIGVKI